jgi:protein phosphatase
MQAAFRSDAGKRRKNNEDAVLIDAKRAIFIVADGMGGARAGEMASRMAVEVTYDHLVATVTPETPLAEIESQMKTAVHRVHETIKFSTQNNPALSGMGTTMVMALVRDNLAIICHAGDSRAYLIRHRIRQITPDHSRGAQMVAEEGVPPEKVPKKAWHALTQALGKSDEIHPEINRLNLKPMDILLLCSDGLTDMVPDKQIMQIVGPRREDMLESVADRLVAAALANGGIDNVSVVLVRHEDAGAFFLRTPLP